MTRAAMATSGLRDYHKKRNFTRTEEPRGKLSAAARRICSSCRSTPRAGCTMICASSSTAC